MSRIIGCEKLHLAPVLTDTSAGATFGEMIEVPSLVSIDIKDNTNNVTFYSDDQIEQVIPAFTGKEVTLTLGYISNELEAKITGNVYKDGIFIQKSDATAGEFALSFRAPLSKGGYQYVTLFKGVFSRKDSKYESKQDKIKGQEVVLNGVFMPLAFNNQVSMKADDTDASNSAAIAKWFTAVEIPTEDSKTPQAEPSHQ